MKNFNYYLELLQVENPDEDQIKEAIEYLKDAYLDSVKGNHPNDRPTAIDFDNYCEHLFACDPVPSAAIRAAAGEPHVFADVYKTWKEHQANS